MDYLVVAWLAICALLVALTVYCSVRLVRKGTAPSYSAPDPGPSCSPSVDSSPSYDSGSSSSCSVDSGSGGL